MKDAEVLVEWEVAFFDVDARFFVRIATSEDGEDRLKLMRRVDGEVLGGCDRCGGGLKRGAMAGRALVNPVIAGWLVDFAWCPHRRW